MGETEDAMQYDEELIFKHLYVSMFMMANRFSNLHSDAFTLTQWMTPLQIV